MPDVDSNGVDTLDRFLAFKYRFMQCSMTEHVFHQVVEHIKELRAERDEARQEVCSLKSLDRCCMISPKGYAELRKWDCYKEDGK